MIMIAGGSGRLGTLLVDRLSARGEDIRVLSPTPARVIRRSVDWIAGDARRPADADRAVAGARIVISAMSAFGLKGVTPRQVDLKGNVSVPLLSTGKTLVLGRARNPVNFVSAHDVAWCIERATTDATLRDTAVDIGGPANLSLLQFVEVFAAATGARGPVKHVPLPMMKLMSVVARPFNTPSRDSCRRAW